MKKRLLLGVLWALTVAGLLSGLGIHPVSAQQAVVTLKIMPLGDSITSSVTTQASYRYWLDKALHAGGIPFNFVGREINNTNGPPLYLDFDRNHEGHSGYATYNFLDPNDPQHNDIGTILAANNPDVVLLHLGTNDLAQGRAISAITADLGKIIDRLRGANPDVRILLAMIIPCTCIAPASRLSDFNRAVLFLGQQKTTSQSPVIVVDQQSGFNASPGADTYDGTHPNQSGEKKMTVRWYQALYFMLLPDAKKYYIPYMH